MRALKGNVWLVVVLSVLLACCSSAVAADVARMSSAELRDRLEEPGLVILDVRRQGDYEREEIKIANAVRVDPGNVKGWVDNYSKEQSIVLYCA